MTTQLATQPASGTVAEPPTTAERVKQLVERPLMILPSAWRANVWTFWSYFEHLAPAQLGLCTQLANWKERGLTLEILQRVFADMTAPSASAKYRFASDLFTDLAARVAAHIDPPRLPPDLELAKANRRAREAAFLARRNGGAH